MADIKDSIAAWITAAAELDETFVIDDLPTSVEVMSMLEASFPDLDAADEGGDDSIITAILYFVEQVFDLKLLDIDRADLIDGQDVDTQTCMKLAEAILYVCINGADKREFVRHIMDLPSDQQEALRVSLQRTNALCKQSDCASPASSVVTDATTCTPQSAPATAASNAGDSVEFNTNAAYLRRENDSLREELEEMRGALARLQASAGGEGASDGNAPWHSVSSSEGTTTTTSSSITENAEATLEAARRETAALEAADALREEVRDLKSQLMAAKTDSADAAALRDQVDVLRSASARAAEAEAALSAARKRIQDLEDLDQAHTRLTASHEKLSASYTELQREVNKIPKLTATLEEQRTAALEAEMRSTDLELQLEAAQEHVAQLQERLSADTAAAGADGAVQVAVSAAPAVHSVEGGMAGGLSEFNPEVAAELERLREENAQLRDTLSSESSDRVVKLETMLEQTRSLKASMETRYKATRKELSASEAAREAAEDSLARTRQSLEETQKELSDTRAERESLHARLSTATAEVASLQESLSATRQQAADEAARAAAQLAQEQNKGEAAVEEVTAQLAAVREEAAAAAAAAAEQEASLRHCLREVQWRTEAENESAQLRFAEVTAQLRADSDAQLQAQAADAQARMEEYMNEHSVSTAEFEAQQEAMRQEAMQQAGVLAVTQSDLREAQDELQKTASSLASLQEQHAALQSQHACTKSSLQDASTKLQSTEAALQGVQGELRKTKAQLAAKAQELLDWQQRSNSAGGSGGMAGGAGHWETMEHLKQVQETATRLEQECSNLRRSLERNGYSAEAIAAAAAGHDTSALAGAALLSAGEDGMDAPPTGTGAAAKRVTRSQAAVATSATERLRAAQAEVSSLQQDKTNLQRKVTSLMEEQSKLRTKGGQIVTSLKERIHDLEAQVTRANLVAERAERAAQKLGVPVRPPSTPLASSSTAQSSKPATAGAAAVASVVAADDDDDDEFNTSASELTGQSAPAAAGVFSGTTVQATPSVRAVASSVPITTGVVSSTTVARTSVIKKRATAGRRSVYAMRAGTKKVAVKPTALGQRPVNA